MRTDGDPKATVIVAGMPSLLGRGVLTGTGAAIGGLLLLSVLAILIVAAIVFLLIR